MQTPGSSFLHERNPNLHTTLEVEAVADYLRAGGEAIPNDPADKISSYLGFLSNREYVNDGILTGDQRSIDRQIDANVIKAEDVPEGYFELQRRIAREQGHGDIHITSEMRGQMIEAVQADQRAGLNKWVEYLGGDDGGYPDWFKTYTWTSVTKLGTYDKEKSEFQKRSRGTVAPYPELNREGLAFVYDVLNKSRVQGEQANGGANDAKLQKLLKNGNFGKVYAHAILEVTPDSPELRKEVKGSWTKFNQTNDPRTARRLSGSLQGHGTGWCTAGESTATWQLSDGDFYVYYTRDQDGKDTVPRVAIRMEDDEVAEVRGVNAAQELEPLMADTTAEKLQDLPGGEEYVRKAEDMKLMTIIEKKLTNNPNTALTSEELRLLYELDHEVHGFGYDYEDDPRISELKKMRGDTDTPEIARVLPEAIREQLQTAYKAYKTVIDNLLNTDPNILSFTGVSLLDQLEDVATPDELKALFASKDKQWQANGTYDYIAEQIIKNDSRFILVATPNIEAIDIQIASLAEDFGKELSSPTRVHDNYGWGEYSAKDLSSDEGNTPIRFSLIESQCDSEMSDKLVRVQKAMLSDRQLRHPELNIRVPSVLDAVAYWYRLHAGSEILNDNNVFYKTHITHFDLQPIEFRGEMLVPKTYVDNFGRPNLHISSIEYRDDVRLAVG